MDFGAHIFGVGALADPGPLGDVARLAEDLGYHSVFVADHVIMPRKLGSRYPYSKDGTFPYDPDKNWLDPMVALGYLAARTTRIRLGTSITVLPMRHPIIMAKQIATADHLSGGRVIFGAGVGWMAEEFALLGASFHDRGRRMDEYLRLMKVLWTERDPRFVGQHFQVSDCGFAPKPVQKPHVPVWVGGESPAALHRAARLADGWHSAGTSLADLPGKLRILGDALEVAGRRRKDFVVSVFPTERFTLELVQRLAAHGVDHVMVPVFSFDADKVRQRLADIASEVIEPYRRGA
ncbi:MAG: LLM class F420-dependent oxidoreductase [candidate division NC10 bacterium]|nr:LLM class F420-dependent oxidoreductase [candidate division NC10 bacterium]